MAITWEEAHRLYPNDPVARRAAVLGISTEQADPTLNNDLLVQLAGAVGSGDTSSADTLRSQLSGTPAPGTTQGDVSFLEQARLLFPHIPEALVSVFAEAWERFGDMELALAQMRQDSRYDQFFPGNRREDGSLRMAESEYLATIEGYRRRLGEFLPTNVVNSILSGDQQRALIEGAVSAAEFGQRLNNVFTHLVSNIEPVREFFAANFGAGDLSDAALFASAIVPGRSPLEFQREIEAAQIGGEASLRGFSIAAQEAMRLESFGLDQMAARRLFGQAQTQLPRLNELIERFNDPDDEVTLAEFTDAVVISDPDQLRQFTRLFGQATAAFSPVGGARPTSQRGALGGLLQS